MNHFDRLMQRALAQPRSAGTALFDPFEQVAPVERLEAPSPFAPASHARPVTPDGVDRNIPDKPTAPQPPHSLPATDASAALQPSPQPPRLAQASNSPVPLTHTASLPQAAPLPPEAAAHRPLDALARADRFMRELGVPGVTQPTVSNIAPSADAVTAHAPPGDRPPSNTRASAVLRHTPPDAAATAHRPRLEPMAPAAAREPAPRPPAANAQPTAATEAATPAVAARKPAPAVAPPATTVVVQAASRSPWAGDIERLGRDTPMARFGLGQC